MESPAATLDMLISSAQQAEKIGDLPAALSAWNDISAIHAHVSCGYSGAARVLRRLNRLDAAEAVLREGLSKAPPDATMLEEYAFVAHERNEWPEAHARWKDLREKHPNSLMGYAGDGVALRCMRQFELAEKLYQDLFNCFPVSANFDLLADYAELAQATGNYAEAASRWSNLKNRFPDRPRGYIGGATNLHSAGNDVEADALIRQAMHLFPAEPTALIEFARMGANQPNVLDTLKRWEAVLSSCPERIDGYLGAAYILIHLRRFADAQNLVHPALQLFPDSLPLAEVNARLALAQNDYEEAVKRWARFRQRYPTSAAGYAGGVEALIELSRFAEADVLSESARILFPDDIHVSATWSYIPARREDWDDAERRWRLTSERFPQAIYVKSGFARALLQNKKWSEAESLISSALEQSPQDIGLLRSYAECATEQSAWEVGEIRWQKVIELFPEASAGWCGLGDMWRRAGRFDAWMAAIKSGLASFPDDFDLEEQLAWKLTLCRDWPAALALWVRLKQKRPNKPSVLSGITQALLEVKQELAVAPVDSLDKPLEIPVALLSEQQDAHDEKTDLKNLLLRFESLGDSCEFGMVQRRFGAEPIGLLRWATTAPEQLTTALKTRFVGVGEEEFTVVSILRGEFVTSDTRYEMYSHTFTPDNVEPLANFTKRHLRRMQYLRRKLIDDLQGSRKIFVYIYNKGLSVNAMRAIHGALRGYNKEAALLCVNVTTDVRRLGEVELIDKDLYVGFIDRYSTVNINYDTWVYICRRTHEMWKPTLKRETASEPTTTV